MYNSSSTKGIASKVILLVLSLLFVLAIACGVVTTFVVEKEIESQSILQNDKINNTFVQNGGKIFQKSVFKQSFGYPPKEVLTSFDKENIYEDFGVDTTVPKIKDNKSIVKNGRGGVVIEQSSRRVLVDEGMDSRCFPASTTKVLTALVVLNSLPLEKEIVIPKAAVGMEGSSIYLKEGEKLTVGELLLGLMLRSGNDAAVALALSVSKSVEDFAELMNNQAKQCGAVLSNFVNPHGLHDDNHYSTPLDLALIAAAAYDNAEFCRIVSTKTAKIHGADGDKYIGNKNKLLNMFDGANGVKTGYTKKSGRCLIGGAMQENMQLISVVLNYNDMWNDTMRMFTTAYQTYHMCPLENAQLHGQDGEEIKVKAGYNSRGEFLPRAYPINKNGNEKIVIDLAKS